MLLISFVGYVKGVGNGYGVVMDGFGRVMFCLRICCFVCLDFLLNFINKIVYIFESYVIGSFF